MSSKNFSYLLLSVIIMMVGVISYSTYLLAFDANPPVEFYNAPFPVDKEEYRAGDEVVVFVDLCKYTMAPFDAHVNFVDGILYSLPEFNIAGSEVGCSSFWTNAATVPQNLPPGTYYLQAKNEYQVNFLVSRIVVWETVTFDVVE